MTEPKIAFCTTCKGRVQHLEKTLPVNLADNPTGVFVVLDYNSQDHLLEYLRTTHRDSIACGRLAVYSYRPSVPSPFRMAHAKNMAHRLGMLEGADILVNLDADNFTGPNFSEYVSKAFSNENDIFLWANVKPEGQSRLPRGCCGRIVVSRNALVKSGGYNEKYETWAPDDKDFNGRLRRLGYSGREIERQFCNVVLHNDKMRFKEYPHISTSVGEEEAFVAAGKDTAAIANYGTFGKGVVFKNFDFTKPIELCDVPTRIFGIGMHKTGTTSLHSALASLGIESAHWKNAHWAKAIWREMNTEGRSLTLEKHYALSDLPIPMLYRKLDLAYPGSKFILTVRNESKWLRSVKKHWDPQYNKFRPNWDTDPFTNHIHGALYGQTTFDASVFLSRYRRHNAEVLAFFKDREKQLLVMNMDNNAGWKELCPFLGQPIPAMPYPKKFVTKRKWPHC